MSTHLPKSQFPEHLSYNIVGAGVLDGPQKNVMLQRGVGDAAPYNLKLKHLDKSEFEDRWRKSLIASEPTPFEGLSVDKPRQPW